MKQDIESSCINITIMIVENLRIMLIYFSDKIPAVRIMVSAKIKRKGIRLREMIECCQVFNRYHSAARDLNFVYVFQKDR